MFKRLVLLAAFAAGVPAVAHAQGLIGGGFRFGFSSSPDQFVLGGQLVVGEVAPQLTFDPSLEFGFGDDRTIVATNFDLHYHIELRDTRWSPYVGAGATISFIHYDNRLGDDSDTQAGGGLVIGAGVPTRTGSRFFTELKFGLTDELPDLKIMAGWNFRM